MRPIATIITLSEPPHTHTHIPTHTPQQNERHLNVRTRVSVCVCVCVRVRCVCVFDAIAEYALSRIEIENRTSIELVKKNLYNNYYDNF